MINIREKSVGRGPPAEEIFFVPAVEGKEEAMRSASTVWALLSLFSTFALPQLLGVLLHFRLVRFSKWLAFVLGVLTPGALFLFLGPIFFFAGLREAELKGPVPCGNAAAALGMMVLAGAAIQVVVALIVQLILLRKQKLNVS